MRKQAVCRNEQESDSDRQFLLSLLPFMRKLSPTDNLDIRCEFQEAIRRTLVPKQNISYGYRTASPQNPSEPSTYVYGAPSPSACQTPSPFASATPSPYTLETMPVHAHGTTEAYAHETKGPNDSTNFQR